MATVTKGKTFGTTEEVTAAKLHQLVDDATVTGIVNADIDASAAIAESKLSLTKTGSDANLVTGTAGTDGNLIKWNADGDAVDSTFGVLDEDDLSSNSATDVPTQQSVKAYVDGGGNGSVTAPTGGTMATSGSTTIAGGLILKYGTFVSTTDAEETFTYPEAFENNAFTVVLSRLSAGGGTAIGPNTFSTSGFTVDRSNALDGSISVNFIAIGN